MGYFDRSDLTKFLFYFVQRLGKHFKLIFFTEMCRACIGFDGYKKENYMPEPKPYVKKDRNCKDFQHYSRSAHCPIDNTNCHQLARL